MIEKGRVKKMLNVTGKYVSVFEAEDKGNFVQANLSTSKKNKDGTYTNMYWRARFVGEAYEPAKELVDKDKIHILRGAIENKFDKEWDRLYITVVIFRFKKNNTTLSPDSNGISEEMENEEQIITDEDLPN